ncbi:uncharacterized protein [Clytia hemisphaerica]|uniref:ISXO2-like transposase domain-containing protein n=1 Tax=Clytia hemisphaerica TaxID=252671 RepID=A0A7M5V3X2_9CNID|eukprot:TCONS_00000808-protein
MAAARQRQFINTWGPVLHGNDIMPIKHFLQGQGVIAVNKIWRFCNQPMAISAYRDVLDGHKWRCPRPCQRTLSLRDGSFFAQWPKIRLGRLFMVIYYWSNNIGVTKIETMTDLPLKTVLAVCQSLRTVCGNHLQRNPIVVGGGGFVVQIDETMMHHRQRNGVGRAAQQPVWVFGMVDTQFAPARGYMEIVQRRDRATLTGVINRNLAANSTIHSDSWAAYNNLALYVPNCIQHDRVKVSFCGPKYWSTHTEHRVLLEQI